MEFLGIHLDVKNKPLLDTGFIPLAKFNEEFLKKADKKIAVAIERNDGFICVFDSFIISDIAYSEANKFYIERLVKLLLWAKGGYKVYICGDEEMGSFINKTYSPNGKRAFDCEFMERVYEKDFEVLSVPYEEKPMENEKSKPLGRHLDGCRIGFDAGGSDRKVSAVIDGKAVYSEEVVWFPKTNTDPDYHYYGILNAFKSAAEHLPKVDAIGISSAGIYINNRTMVASLFLKVAKEDFNEKVKDIYLRAAKEIGDIPIEVANDGDVTALAGAMSLKDNNVLGIAMGTSEAAGYVDKDGNITGWLNELAFAPVDGQDGAMVDEWSGDKGCGVKYFSQDAIIKLAPKAGITLSENLSPAEKLKAVQKLLDEGKECAIKIYETIGAYLGHTIAHYTSLYDMKHILLLGRVMSGHGGNIIISIARQVLLEEYADLERKIELHLPDEKIRRVGQSVAAASLPEIK